MAARRLPNGDRGRVGPHRRRRRSGPRGVAARAALAASPAAEPLVAPGHLAFEVVAGLRAAANRPGHPLRPVDLAHALQDAEALGILIEATPWADVRRAEVLSRGSLCYADAVYVAAAERHGTTLLTADARIARSGAPVGCAIVTVGLANGTGDEDITGLPGRE